MSISIMSLVFAADMPELKTDDGKTVPDSTAKFVLLALADHASDDGENAYIGVKRICQKTNFSTATVCNALNALRNNGFITLIGKSKRDTNNYSINSDRLQPLKFQPLKSSDSSGYNPSVLAAKVKSSVKPSVKHQKDVVLSKDEIKSAGDSVSAYLAMQNPAKAWKGREVIRPDLLVYADWYHEQTGQVITRNSQAAWLKALPAWKEEGLEIAHLQTALDARRKYRTVATPLELTTDAAAVKAAGAVNNDENTKSRFENGAGYV